MELTTDQALKLALSHHGAGRLDQAEELYRLILNADPGDTDAMDMLGALISQRGRHEEGLALVDQSIALRSDSADYHSNRGLILFSMGRSEDAVEAYRKALKIHPDFPNALSNLGNALLRLDQNDEALACYQRALAISPQDPTVHLNLGHAYVKLERFDEAIASLRHALELRPEFAEAMNNLGSAYLRSNRADEAIEMYAQAVKLRSHMPDLVNNLAGALKDAGRVDESLAWYRRAVATTPTHLVHSNLVYLLNFHPDYDAKTIAAELNHWNTQIAHPITRENQPHTNMPSPDRRLRVGYVSPNFHMQAEAHFVLPLLESHDHREFEIHCFAADRKPDQITDRHRKCADVWHDVSRDTDEQLARKIRESRIDILVDLTMHMGDNRLLAFARKPAPVQMTWLAYPGSTGLETMDYRITDAIIDPPDRDDAVYSERSIRLPVCWCCYDPISDALPRPITQTGPITFGSLNNPCKLNPQILRLWAQVLRQVKDSRLLLLSVSQVQQRQIIHLFAETGVTPDRIEFVESCRREPYLRIYDRIDIALDPLPYNGITTTCDALWMGVPVVTLTGSTAAGRAGASVLAAAGYEDLVSYSPQQFINIATDLSRDLHRLMAFRAGARKEIEQSDLMNGSSFARRMESAYHEVWTAWCQTRGRRKIGA